MVWICIAVFVFCIDYRIKKLAEERLEQGSRKEMGGGFFLQKVYNKGFALNRLEKKPNLVKWIQAGLMLCLGIYSIQKVFFQGGKKSTALGVAMILGGGASNLLDRFQKGYVVDYLGLPGIKKVIFNLSDLFVFLGSIFVFFGEMGD